MILAVGPQIWHNPGSQLFVIGNRCSQVHNHLDYIEKEAQEV